MKRAVESALRRAVEQLPHPVWEELADRPVTPMEEHDYITRQVPPARRVRWARPLAAVAMLALCMGLGWGYLFGQVVSVVDLDVNPSFELTANRRDRVLEARGLNPEAAVLLEELDLTGQPLPQAMEALAHELTAAGYLTNDHTAVLLSVHSREQGREEQLQETLARSVETGAGPDIQPQVVRQSLKMEPEVRQRAQETGISSGRQQYIDRLLEQRPALSEEELLQRTVQELWELERDDDDDDDWDDLDDLDDSDDPDEWDDLDAQDDSDDDQDRGPKADRDDDDDEPDEDEERPDGGDRSQLPDESDRDDDDQDSDDDDWEACDADDKSDDSDSNDDDDSDDDDNDEDDDSNDD